MNLTLYLTFDCNQRCRYCFAAPQQKSDMSLATALEAISIAANATKRNGDHHLGVRFFGGEPLMRWDMIPTLVSETRRISAAHGLVESFSVSTNAILLGEEQRNFLLENDVAVGISIDGSSEVHDRNRLDTCGQSSFELVLHNARRAIEADLRVELVLVVDPSTIEHLPASVRYLRTHLGADFFILSFNIDAEWTPRDLTRLSSAYRELGDYYVEQFEEGRPLQIDALNNKINVLLRGGFIKEGLCRIGKSDLAVTPDGRIYPCLRLAAKSDGGAMAIGHVTHGMDLDATRELRNACQTAHVRGGEPSRCHTCRHSQTCLNWCVAANLATSGTAIQPGVVICQYERVCIGVARRVIQRVHLGKYLELYNEYLPSLSSGHDAVFTTDLGH